jgi:hypothetical protein
MKLPENKIRIFIKRFFMRILGLVLAFLLYPFIIVLLFFVGHEIVVWYACFIGKLLFPEMED